MPGFHWLITRPNGGKSVPLLLTKAGTFTDSTDILQYLDAIAPTSQLESRAIAESSDYYENQLHGRRCLNHRSKLGDKLKHI
ncbi:thioredoxin domain-containing protein [Nostoc sp.]